MTLSVVKSKDMETDKYYLIDTGCVDYFPYYFLQNEDIFYCNVTAEVKQINKNGDYIKKFNIELTGKANYSERVAKAQGPTCHTALKCYKPNPIFILPKQTSSMVMHNYLALCKNPTQTTLAKDPRPQSKPPSMIRINALLDFTCLKGRKKIKSIRNSLPLILYLIGKQLQHITGTIHDYFKAKKDGKIEILKMRTETKMQDFVSGGSVKIINGHELTQPQVLHNPPEKRAQSASRIKYETLPQTTETRAQTSQQSRVIVPLEEQKLKSMQSYGTLNQELQNTESKALFQSRTYIQTSQSKRSQNVIDQNVQLYNIPHFQERLDIFKKEIQSFTLPQPKEIKQITSKGRFNCHLADNKEHYMQDRLMMKLFQPEQFKSNESPKKQEMEKQRRILAKMKETDMLTRNLKLKL